MTFTFNDYLKKGNGTLIISWGYNAHYFKAAIENTIKKTKTETGKTELKSLLTLN